MNPNPVCGVCEQGHICAAIWVILWTGPIRLRCGLCGRLAAEHTLNPDRPGLEDDVAAPGQAETQKER